MWVRSQDGNLINLAAMDTVTVDASNLHKVIARSSGVILRLFEASAGCKDPAGAVRNTLDMIELGLRVGKGVIDLTKTPEEEGLIGPD